MSIRRGRRGRRGPRPRSSPRWPGYVDGALDGLVVAFAVWTVVYQVFLATQDSMLWLGWPWLATAAVVAVLGARFGVRLAGPGEPAPDRAASSPLRTALAAGLGVLLAVAVVLRTTWGMTPVAVLTVVLLVLLLVPWWGRGRAAGADQGDPGDPGDQGDPDGPRAWEHVVAALGSVGLGVLAAFLLRPDADDVFYVNRATWVAERGTAATRDTMFSPDVLPPAYQGGLPTPSIEALQGTLASALGVSAPTLVYLIAVPVLAVAAGWTTWRLVRAWAGRRALPAFVVANLFLLASAASVLGRYGVARIWQGKVIAFAILVPIIWYHLSRLAARPSRYHVAVLLAAGVAFVGLTTTSALQAPVLAGVALVAAVVLRSRPLALGAGALLVGPLVNAAAQVLSSAAIGDPNAVTATPARAFKIAFGLTTPMALLGFLACAFALVLVRGRAAVLVGCGMLATTLTFVPGVLSLADAVTGAGPVVWRLAILMPVWVLVGLLVTVSPPALERPAWLRLPAAGPVTAGVAAAVVVAVVAASGTWIWSSSTGAQLTSRPVWKVPQRALADVRAAERLRVGDGLWLMPSDQMKVLAITRVGPFPVVARGYYGPNLKVPAAEFEARKMLFLLEKGRRFPAEQVARSLRLLDVSLACVPGSRAASVRILTEAVGESLEPVGSMRCHVRAG